jgi:hypothetical protein
LSEQDRSILNEAAKAAVDIQNATDSNLEAENVGVLCRGGERSPSTVPARPRSMPCGPSWNRSTSGCGKTRRPRD